LGRAIELSSPDGRIHFSFQAADSGLYYSVTFRETTIIDRSPLGLSFQETGDFGKNCLYHSPIYREGEDKYDLIVGKTHSVHDFYREVEISLEQRAGQHRRISILVRLFNDGLAFRYLLPQQAGWSSYNLTDENTCFRVTGDPLLLASFLPGYTTSHEGRYTRIPFSKTPRDTLMDMPVFMELGGGSPAAGTHAAPPHNDRRIYVAVTEAELVDYAGMYLVKRGDCLKSALSPLPEPSSGQSTNGLSGQPSNGSSAQVPDRQSIKVRATLPHRTPWRVLLMGDRPGALIESNILTSLNEPCAIKDVSWIRPGKTDFHWWNGDIVPDTTFSPGINFETNQYYIDFCARNGIAYHSIIGFGGLAWYTNDGISYGPGPHSDVTRPIPGLDMKQLSDYAEKKGVGIRVWVHWKALYPMIDKAFEQFEKWGIRGMMVDFMDRDDQEMVNIQTEILQKAALHHLHIQFHGAYKPTGLSRTYPNEFTREGTLNYENDKWDNPITPEDDLNVVFTRLLAGPTDYHLGGFRAVPAAGYRPQFTRPLVLGTRCHMLAMYVILESYLGMVCDYPAAYEGQPGFDFIKAVPTTWDETKAPAAVPGEWVTIARRKGSAWYVGTINNSTPRQVTMPLNFLSPGSYEVTIYRDADDAAAQPNHLIVETRTVQASDTLTATLAPGGGMAVRLSPKN